VGPFVLIFFITLFILVMQFLWKYIDELVGKGLEWYVMMELLFYASASLVPLALPLSLLLSSMMTVGGLGEHYELTGMKSGGLSLFRILRSMMVASLVVSLGALAFSNYVLPVANLKFGSLLYDIRQQRPALNIKPGVFNKDIDGYSIRVGAKAPDNKTIYNVLIYDHTGDRNAENVLFAKRGKMFTTDDKRYMILELHDGVQYQETAAPSGKDRKNEQMRSSFKTWHKVLDLSAFNLNRSKEEIFKGNYQMMNIRQLNDATDTLLNERDRAYKQFRHFIQPYFVFQRENVDSIVAADKLQPLAALPQDTISATALRVLHQKAMVNIRNVKGYASITANDLKMREDLLVRHRIEWHRKFTLSLACFLLFFIGAPLGAIIRKGGFGLPFVVSILFFVLYYMITITGEKFAKQGSLSPTGGMWLSVIVLFPMGLWLTYKASRDSVLFNKEAYASVFRWVVRRFKQKKVDAPQSA
ncbi:MAG TPA: LptF/LptG family permease, partial [Chitinophagales bacterium]|nr:LptF/LptG family permease [Chitinophagales bacterium]